MSNMINLYDFDGVTSIGVTPRPGDIIITGRTIDEYSVVNNYLESIGLLGKVMVYFNPINFAKRGEGTEEARTYSGNHKASIVKSLIANSVNIGFFFEDDPIQRDIIVSQNPSMRDKIILIPKTVDY